MGLVAEIGLGVGAITGAMHIVLEVIGNAQAVGLAQGQIAFHRKTAAFVIVFAWEARLQGTDHAVAVREAFQRVLEGVVVHAGFQGVLAEAGFSGDKDTGVV
ncbi:hypothetical protein D3C79_929190 [compost metagenome]